MRKTLLILAILFFGITLYSCSPSDMMEAPVQTATVGEDGDIEEEDENGTVGEDGDIEEEDEN